MPTSWSSLYLDWTMGMTDYIARHVANYSRVQTCLDYLYAVSGGGRSMLDVPLGLQEIFDRDGIIGKNSYKPPGGVKTAPDYNLVIPKGAYWSGTTFLAKSTTTTIPLGTLPTGTYYIELDGAGNPSVKETTSSTTVWQFEWSTSTHGVTNIARYTGVDILFDGDDYHDCLFSYNMGNVSFESIGERFDYLEAYVMSSGELPGDFAVKEINGMAITLNPGKFRNNNVIVDIVIETDVTMISESWNYIEINPGTEEILVNQIGYTVDFIPLHRYEFGVLTTIESYSDDRCWLTTGGGGGGGGHTQNTDIGTTAAEFKLLKSVTGAPSQIAKFSVERGTSPDVSIRWNESTDKWEYTEDGTSWKTFGDFSVDIGSQMITQYVPINSELNLVHEELLRGSSTDYEEIDLSSWIDAPDGVDAVVLRVAFWDDGSVVPSPYRFVRFRKGGEAGQPWFSHAVFAPANDDWSRPQTVMLGVDDNNKIEFYVDAYSILPIVNMRIYIIGYFKKVLGVGTQNQTLSNGDMVVAANSTADFNIAGFGNRGLIHYFKIEETEGLITGTYDVAMFANDLFTEASLLYRAEGILPGTPFEDFLPWWHSDDDLTKEVHIRIINNDLTQQATFVITLKCEMFA